MTPMTDHAVARRLVVPYSAVRALRRAPAESARPRPLARAFAVIADLAMLTLVAWLIPVVILAIAGPFVLVLWAVMAIIHRL